MVAKKIILGVFTFFFACCFGHGYSANPGRSSFESCHWLRSDTADLEQRLVKFKYKKYIDKPIGELLADVKLDYRKILFVQMRPLCLAFVSVIYSDDLRLDIYTENYSYLKRFLNEDETEQVWKVEDLLKEKVTKIRVRTRHGRSLKEYPPKPVLPVI